MHGGLPPSNTFPFTSFHAGLLQLAAGDPAATAAAPAQDKGDAHATVMKIDDPLLVATAQQYNMHAHVGPKPCLSGETPLSIQACPRVLVIVMHC
jgi:hypothetical protein